MVRISDLEKTFGKPVYTYTEDQAVDDGILARLEDLLGQPQHVFNYVTTNLLDHAYLYKDGEQDRVNTPALHDLLTQSAQLMRADEPDTFYSGTVELPSGQKQQVFIQQNTTGKYTIMLPEDY